MNKIIVKSTSGLLWGVAGSLTSVYLANLYESKYTDNVRFLKKKLYFPLLFGGITGFVIGFTTTPILSLLKRN